MGGRIRMASKDFRKMMLALMSTVCACYCDNNNNDVEDDDDDEDRSQRSLFGIITIY